jgi:hypothetical protein
MFVEQTDDAALLGYEALSVQMDSQGVLSRPFQKEPNDYRLVLAGRS